MGFQKAVREKLKALIAMMGASGSGKTFSSLVMAKGMIKGMFPDLKESDQEFWDKIAVVDTEHNRSKIYADVEKHDIYFGAFQHMNISKPFTPEKYMKAIEDAKNAGIEVLILDSTTHLWKYLLELQKDLGGRYQDWKEPDKEYQDFIDAFTQTDMHIIATMRSKQSYALEAQGETGKLGVAKLGEKPIQRDDFEYEFLLGLMFDQRHYVHATKDNTPLFEELGEFKVTEQHGIDLVEWLDKGKDVRAEQRKQEAEEKAKKEAEAEEKESMIKTIKAFGKSEVPGMFEYANEKIKGTVSKAGQLENLKIEQLKKFVHNLNDKEQELKKTAEVTLEEEPDSVSEAEKSTLKELQEVAKSFKIKGYTKMSKQELVEAIREAQGKEPAKA